MTYYHLTASLFLFFHLHVAQTTALGIMSQILQLNLLTLFFISLGGSQVVTSSILWNPLKINTCYFHGFSCKITSKGTYKDKLTVWTWRTNDVKINWCNKVQREGKAREQGRETKRKPQVTRLMRAVTSTVSRVLTLCHSSTVQQVIG